VCVLQCVCARVSLRVCVSGCYPTRTRSAKLDAAVHFGICIELRPSSALSTHMHTHKHTHIHTHKPHTHMHTHTHTHTHTCTHTHTIFRAYTDTRHCQQLQHARSNALPLCGCHYGRAQPGGSALRPSRATSDARGGPNCSYGAGACAAVCCVYECVVCVVCVR